MAQWGRNDQEANSVSWAPALLNKVANSTTSNALFNNTTSSAYITGATHGMFGVSDVETIFVDVAHAGWNLKTTGSGGRAGRVIYETLVTSSSFTGDAADGIDNYVILVSTDPSASEVTEDDPATFTVVAITNPTGGSIDYLWQVDVDANGTFVNVAEAGVYSNVDTATLSISNTNGLTDGSLWRARLSNTNTTTVYSEAAALTFS